MSTTLIVAMIVLLAAIPCGWRICAVLPLAVLQIYVPGLLLFGAPVSLAFIVAASFWREFLHEFTRLARRKSILALVLLLIASIVAMVWSVDLHLAFVGLSGILVFLFVASATYRQARRDARWLRLGSKFLAIMAVMFCASVVVFRLIPIVKMGFLQTNLGAWFINANTLLELFMDSRNNVLDPAKSGGFGFVNANIASSFLGMLAMIFFGLGRASAARAYTILGFAVTCVVPFTGSKAGTMLVLPMLALVLVTANGRKGLEKKVILLGAIAVLATLIATILPSFESGMQFGKQVAATTNERSLIWRFAGEQFMKNPVFGLGFGGWQVAFPPYARFVGISEGYPPHNTFIYLWSQAGVIAMLLGVWFVWEVLRGAMAGLRADDAAVQGLAVASGLSAFWLTAQGMGENMGLLGDTHEQIIFGSYLAWLSWEMVSRKGMARHGNA